MKDKVFFLEFRGMANFTLTDSRGMQINVIKIGGNVIDVEEKLQGFLKSFAALEGPKVLVHGGERLLLEWRRI